MATLECQFSYSSDPDYRSGSTETSRPALLYEATHGFSDPVNEGVTSDRRDDGTTSARSFSLDKQRLSYPASSIHTAAVLTTSSLVSTGFDHSTAECHVPLKHEAPQVNAIAGAVSDVKILVSKIRVRPFNLCDEQVVLCATKVSKMKDKSNIRGRHTILWYGLDECQFLVRVDLEQTATARGDMIKTLITKGPIRADLVTVFVEGCRKSLEEQCRCEGVPWEVTVCGWNKEEEKRMETRSSFVQCLQGFAPLWAKWKDFKRKYGGEVTEAMIQEDCGDVLDVVKDLDSSLSEDNQVVVFTELNPFAHIDLEKANKEKLDEKVLQLLKSEYAGTETKARLLDIPHIYWKFHGPLPLSRDRVQGQGTTLYSFLCDNPGIAFEGAKVSDIFIAAKFYTKSSVDRKVLVASTSQPCGGSKPYASSVPTATISKQSYPSRVAQPSDGSKPHTSSVPTRTASKQSYPSMVERRPFDYRVMSKENLKLCHIQQLLTREMYKEKFHKLLFWEENEHETILKEKCDGKYTLVVLATNDRPQGIYSQPRYERYGYLTGITGDQVAYATQASEGLTIIVEKGTKISQLATCIQTQKVVTAEANILRENFSRTEDQLYLAFDDTRMLINLEIGKCESCSIPVRIEFKLKHSYFESLHQSLMKLPHPLVQRIFPDGCHFPMLTSINTSHLLEDSCELSDDQEQALQAMLSTPSHGPPFLLSGPFGTGKTFLLAAAAHCFFKQGREKHCSVTIFVGTQQHTAAQKFLDCFINIMLPRDDIFIVRVVPKNHHKKCDEQEYTKTTPEFDSNLASFKKQRLCLVISTCMTSMQLGRHLPGSFTHLLLDEGANIREPEGIIPFQLAHKNTKIVIAGDQHQVGPSLLVLGDEAHSNGLSKSLQERLQEHYTSLGDSAKGYHMMLVSNYRCHAGILRLVEGLFYSTQLLCRVRDGSAHPGALFPLKFICSSVDDAMCSIESMTNEREAKIVLQEAKKICSTWPEDTWGKRDFSQICVISPTRSQITVISKLLSKHHERMRKIDRLPTYDIQGREFRAVFISTSEPTVMSNGTLVSPSNPTKSISDRFVFNTVVTRSRSMVVAIGNPFLLLKVEQHMVQRYGEMGKCWSHYLDACIRNRSLSIDPDSAAPQGCLEKIEEYVQRSLAVQC